MSISISEHEAIEQAMTAGEWTWDDEHKQIEGPTNIVIVETDSGYYPPRLPDALGICAMRNAYPAVLAVVRAALEMWASTAYDRRIPEAAALTEALKAVRP